MNKQIKNCPRCNSEDISKKIDCWYCHSCAKIWEIVDQPIQTQKPVSTCCKGMFLVVSSDEGTSYYQCAVCHKPCDAEPIQTECGCHCHCPEFGTPHTHTTESLMSNCEHCTPLQTQSWEERAKESIREVVRATRFYIEGEITREEREAIYDRHMDFISKLLKAQRSQCNHTEPDYMCPCFFEGFETADAEQCYNKLDAQRNEYVKQLNEILKQGHGGGNWRRLITQAIAVLEGKR